ncbi:MAG: hypothetical protein ACRC33_14475 [Gemmataceae bacterium]
MNAADFGCPQRRVRCFLLAARESAVPAFPPPTHAERPGGGLFEAHRPWVTLGEFLASRPGPDSADIAHRVGRGRSRLPSGGSSCSTVRRRVPERRRPAARSSATSPGSPPPPPFSP